MKIYALINYDSIDRIIGIFATKEAADDALAMRIEYGYDPEAYWVEAMAPDEEGMFRKAE